MITMNVSGNITADAITKNVNGTDVISFTVASNRRYTTQGGEVKEETIYMPCFLWNKKEAAPMLHKGRAVNITGYFNVRNYVAADGTLKTFYSVRVSSFQVFGKKPQTTTANSQPEEQPQELHNDTPPAEVMEDLPF